MHPPWLSSLSLAAFAAMTLVTGALYAESPAIRVQSAVSMDRWIDVTWACASNPSSGFAIELSRNGRDFVRLEQVGPAMRCASVFLSANATEPATVSLRVAALGADGLSGICSEPLSVAHSGKARDIETELRKRFDYPAEGRPYNVNDPATKVIYTQEQMQSQRDATKAMLAELNRAVNASASSFTIPPGIYRVDADEIKLTGLRNLVHPGNA